MKLSKIFSINRRNEKESELNNKYLLFHGTRAYNILGILAGGLKIAPVEAPTTGYNFGKGIYFADMISKSIDYAQAEYWDKDKESKSYIFICEVSMGNTFDVGLKNVFKNEIDIKNKGYNSVKALGMQGPNLDKMLYLNNGSSIPIGEIIHYDFKEFKGKNLNMMPVSEYIVYNESQVKIKFLVEINN